MMIIIIIVLVAIVIWLLIKYGRVRCPDCGGRMKMTKCTDTTNVWTCTKCSRKITVEEYDE